MSPDFALVAHIRFKARQFKASSLRRVIALWLASKLLRTKDTVRLDRGGLGR